jgi:hypothetical protein
MGYWSAGLQDLQLTDAAVLSSLELRPGTDLDVRPGPQRSAVSEPTTSKDDGAPLITLAAVQVRVENNQDFFSRLERELS